MELYAMGCPLVTCLLLGYYVDSRQDLFSFKTNVLLSQIVWIIKKCITL